MKITLIGTMYPIKGISPYCLELLRSIPETMTVDFIGFDKLCPECIYPGGTKIAQTDYFIPEMKNVTIRNVLTYYNPLGWIREGLTAKGDIIHAQWWEPRLLPVFLTLLATVKIRRKKIVITVHNVTPHNNIQTGIFLNRILFRFADAFIVHTIDNRNMLSDLYHINLEKIFVIPHGILEIASPQTIVSPAEARSALGLSAEKKYLLHFGYIRDYKGVDILLKALSLVIPRRNDINLIIIGPNWENQKKYEDLIDEYQIREHTISKMEYIPDNELVKYIISSDLIVFPYKFFNSQSAAGMLAVSYHRPILVTRVGGLSELVKDPAFISKPNDSGDLAEKILDIFNNPALLEQAVRQSEEVSEMFHWKKSGEKLEQLYKKLLDNTTNLQTIRGTS